MNKKLFLEILTSSVIVGVFVAGGFYFINKPKMVFDTSINKPAAEEIKSMTIPKIGHPDTTFNSDDYFDFRNTPAKLYVDNKDGYYFQYPEKSDSKYISIGNGTWPPQATLTSGVSTCNPHADQNDGRGITTVIKRSFYDFCVTEVADGAMGTTYVNYSYVSSYDSSTDVSRLTEEEKKLPIFDFTIAYVNCGNYDEPQKSECEKEQSLFSVDGFVSGVLLGGFQRLDVGHFTDSAQVGWKTYTNSKYNFKLDIPKDWTLFKQEQDYVFRFYSPSGMLDVNNLPGPIYTVGLSIGDDAIYNKLKAGLVNKDSLTELKELKLGGKTFTSYFYDQSCNEYHLEIENNGRSYVLEKCNDTEGNEDLKKIATSLQFTN